MRNHKRTISAARLLSVCALAWPVAVGAAARAQPAGMPGPPPASVALDAARMESVEPLREVRGELRAIRRSLVAAEEPGLVVEIGVEAGDVVERGEPVARLDDALLLLEAQRAEAEVQRREGLLEERRVQQVKAQRDVHRLEEMKARSSATQNETDDAESLLSAARARTITAEAELVWAKIDLARLRERQENMVVRAPYTGRIISRRTDVGQWLKEGEAVVEMVALGEVDAWLAVPQQFLAALREAGRPLQIRVEATGDIIAAPVTAVAPTVDPQSRMFPVRVRLANAEGLLLPGMSVVGLAPTGGRETMLTIHKDAVLRDDAGAFVFFSAGGIAVAARIEPLFAVGDRVVVRSQALKDGTLVVIEGNERLTPGRPLLAPAPPPPEGPPKAPAAAEGEAPGKAAKDGPARGAS